MIVVRRTRLLENQRMDPGSVRINFFPSCCLFFFRRGGGNFILAFLENVGCLSWERQATTLKSSAIYTHAYQVSVVICQPVVVCKASLRILPQLGNFLYSSSISNCREIFNVRGRSVAHGSGDGLSVLL